MFHKITDNINVAEDLTSISRVAASYTGLNTIDTTLYEGGMLWFIQAGTFGGSATLDALLEESVNADMSSPSNVASGAITQLTAAGTASLSFRVRTFTKRYVRLKATVAVAAVVCSASFVGQKKLTA